MKNRLYVLRPARRPQQNRRNTKLNYKQTEVCCQKIGLWEVRISISGVGEWLGVMINVGCMNEEPRMEQGAHGCLGRRG